MLPHYNLSVSAIGEQEFLAEDQKELHVLVLLVNLVEDDVSLFVEVPRC